MPLADHKPPPLVHRPGPPCSMAVLLETLNDADREELQMWLDTPEISTQSISEALAREGIKRTPYVVGWHRKRNCRCYL